MRKIRIMVSVVLIILAVFFVVKCARKNTKVDWDLCGTWIAEDGSVLREIEFSFKATFPRNYKSKSWVDIDSYSLEWPDGFALPDLKESDYSATVVGVPIDSDNLYLHLFVEFGNPDPNKISPGAITFHPEKGLFKCLLSDGSFVIASTDPDVDKNEWDKLMKSFNWAK